MNQRSEIMNEFFVLKNELNWSNKFADQKTELVFEINEEASGRQILFEKLSDDQKVMLCEQRIDSGWIIANSNKYPALGQFVFNLIIRYENYKHLIKIGFNEYFYIEFNKLLGFK